MECYPKFDSWVKHKNRSKASVSLPQKAIRIIQLPNLARLSTFASKTPAVAGVLLVGLHYTAFRDAIREDSRQTTPSRGVTQRKKFAVEANVESRAGCDFLALGGQ